jgi:CDP-diacylglycerol--glycerol-3-phosphate 3-phosphatidyltransferase
LPAAVIIGREITVSALREWMAEIGARAKVAVSMAGKLKTTAQMIAIVLLISAEPVLGAAVSPISV